MPALGLSAQDCTRDQRAEPAAGRDNPSTDEVNGILSVGEPLDRGDAPSIDDRASIHPNEPVRWEQTLNLLERRPDPVGIPGVDPNVVSVRLDGFDVGELHEMDPVAD